jgi:peptidoglycan-associated lipoprotein
VVDYLINAGIPAERLQAQGYGESRPKKVTKRIAREHPELPEGQLLDEEYIMTLPEELQEIADQINRRTEFQVLSINYNMF